MRPRSVMRPVLLLAVLLLATIIATLLAVPSTPSPTSAQDLIQVTLGNTDQLGQPLEGGLVTLAGGGVAMDGNPFTYTIANGGATYPRGQWGGVLSPQIGLTVWKDTTYGVDALTGAVTTETTPGVNRVNFVFEPVEVTVDSVDQLGQHLEGGSIYLGDDVPQPSVPYTFAMANGGEMGFYVEWGGLASDVVLAAPKDTTYWVDALTNETIESESTPGTNQVNFVFEPIQVTVDVVDRLGQHLEGVLIYLEDDIPQPSVPFVLAMANGGEVGFYIECSGMQSDVAFTILKDTTYWVDALTSETIETESTPGVNRANIVFENTPAGNDVSVELNGGTEELGGIDVTFSLVATGGNTTVTTATAGPPPPTGFKILGLEELPLYFDINSDASYSGDLTVCIRYDETQVAGPEADLKLMHYVDEGFVDITTSVDTANDIICGKTTHLSTFVVAEPVATATPTPPTGVGGVVKLPPAAVAAESGAAAEGSGWTFGAYAALVGVGAAAAMGIGGWYARRRWLR